MNAPKNFPKIAAVQEKYRDYIVGNDVEITEKIDGSAFVFGKQEGKLVLRSKGTDLDRDNPDVIFKPAVAYVLSIEDKLPDDMCFYAETLCRPRHNQLAYNRVPVNHIALYGASYDKSVPWIPYDELVMWADRFTVEVVPLLHKGPVYGIAELEKLYKGKISVLGKSEMEGIVIKNYDKSIDHGGDVSSIAPFKIVSDKFKEAVGLPKGVKQDEKLSDLLARFKTEARWHKAVQHLRERGELTESPKDIGPLMKELNIDLVQEESDNFKEALYELYRKDWLAKTTEGFALWYKQQLGIPK